jgi:hypothetical protein
MTKDLRTWLIQQVLNLHDVASATNDKKYRDMADELNEMLNNELEIRGTVS